MVIEREGKGREGKEGKGREGKEGRGREGFVVGWEIDEDERWEMEMEMEMEGAFKGQGGMSFEWRKREKGGRERAG